jgi:ElaA protein
MVCVEHTTYYLLHLSYNLLFIQVNELTFIHKPFSELTPYELYAILQLRNEVFIVEQNCVFQDADNKDQVSLHVMCWQNDLLAGYTRLVPPGVAYDEASIGRVVTSPKVRHAGIGKLLMQYSIRTTYDAWGKTTITIGAQFYLRSFYSSMGFQQCSDIYLEDGIQHIKMFLPINS